uniref:Transmembrane protein n=1 Tax=Meloidogyne hapla TaxID=6305 RepID=A0A1I8B6K0_MELHA
MQFNVIFILIFLFINYLNSKSHQLGNLFNYIKKLIYKKLVECFLFFYLSLISVVYLQQSQQLINKQLNQPQTISTKICANSGRFMQTYCISDYNCNSGRPIDWSDPSQIQVCIRGWCCSQTVTPKSQVNVYLTKDQSCPKGTFNVELLCHSNEDCIRTGGVARIPFPILECGNQGFCCTSSKYIKPLQYGDICLNGGNALGQKCQKAEECQQRQQNVGNVNTGSLFCIDDECCTQQQQFPSQPNQNQRNVVKPNLDDKQIIANKCPYGIFTGKYCSSSDECGSPSTTFCYQGICCSTASKPDTGLDDFSRGTATCSVYNYKYFNRHCATPLNCGFQTDNFLCISGYCCAKYNSKYTYIYFKYSFKYISLFFILRDISSNKN